MNLSMIIRVGMTIIRGGGNRELLPRMAVNFINNVQFNYFLQLTLPILLYFVICYHDLQYYRLLLYT